MFPLVNSWDGTGHMTIRQVQTPPPSVHFMFESPAQMIFFCICVIVSAIDRAGDHPSDRPSDRPRDHPGPLAEPPEGGPGSARCGRHMCD